MAFRFYTNVLSQASRTLASSLLVIGLLLIGFGMLIMALPKVFALLAAAVFFVAGIGCAVVAVRILWAQRRMNRFFHDDLDAPRQNVRIHTGGRHDF